jgi:hypothetical protein
MPVSSNEVWTYTFCKQKTVRVFDEVWNIVTLFVTNLKCKHATLLLR